MGSIVGRVSGIVPQLSRYSVASALALALDFAVYLTLTTSAVSPPVAGVVGYALGTALHFLLSTRFVFDARATDKLHARLLGEFALSGIAGIGITALVIALATRGGGPGGPAGQGAGGGCELHRGVRAAAHCGVLAAQLRGRASTRSRSGLRILLYICRARSEWPCALQLHGLFTHMCDLTEHDLQTHPPGAAR